MTSFRLSRVFISFLAFHLAAVPALRSQVEVWRTLGEVRSDRVGTAVAIVPDADGDALPDVLVGAPSGDVVISGNITLGLPGRMRLRSSATGAVLREWVGGMPGDQFGARVADVGDTDGDGSHDFGVTAPRHPTAGFGPGALFVYSGADGSLLHALLNNLSTIAEYGTDVAGIGDVDGDGGSDFLSSNVAFGGLPSNEAVSVVSGRTGDTIRTHLRSVPWAITGLGIDLDGAGDVDGDSVGDYVVGAPFDIYSMASENGLAFVYSGASGQLLWSLADPNHVDTYGLVVSGAGDVDGDGLADLLAGTPNYSGGSSRGVVNVHSGATGAVLATANGASGDNLGGAISETGDADGDSFPDFVATAATRPSLRVFSSATGAQVRSHDLDPSSNQSVDASADMTGDGEFDVLAGFPESPAVDQLVGAGRCAVIDAASGAVVIDIRGLSFQSRCGESAAILPDRDGDGQREVAIGLPGGVGSTVGLVRVLSGASGAELAHVSAGTPLDLFGAALASVGDLDGDGTDDLAVGAPGHQGVGKVELRSGIDDHLIATIAAPSGAGAFGGVLAAAVDGSGGSFLAIGDPAWTNGGKVVGRVEIHDFVHGTALSVAGATHGARFSAALACVGDATGDGVLDWVVGEPDQDVPLEDSGRIHLISGSDGSESWQRDGTLRQEELGTSVAGLGDLDGDGIGEVIAGSPDAKSGRSGRALLCSGKDGATLHQLNGASTNDHFGAAIAHLGDVNGDGDDDFAIGAPLDGYVQLFSGATISVLYRFDGLFGILVDGERLGSATWGRDTRVDGDPVPDLVIGLPEFGDGVERRGIATLRRLAPLFVQVTPPSPPVGFVATAESRGGPPGRLGVLFIVAFDGAPRFDQFATGFFDGSGEWSISDIVPPSLSGHSFELRSFVVGFAGKVVATQDALVVVP